MEVQAILLFSILMGAFIWEFYRLLTDKIEGSCGQGVMTKVRPSTHPGVILKEEFAIPLKLTQATMAEDLHIGIKTISELYNEKRGITPVMALKLSGYFGSTPQFWMNLQNAYDLHKAYEKSKDEIEKISFCEAA